MSLEEWLRNGWLTAHKTSREEIFDLFRLIDRDLRDCQASALSPDWKLNIAYNAALQSAKTALGAAGYRAPREAHHYRTIHSLEHTVQADQKFIVKLDLFRKKRNISDYERAGTISDQEVDELIDLAKSLRDMVEKWLRKNYPDFFKK
ncbi:HEPN domain-containing protein [Acidobacteriota bacterium]